MKFSEDRSQIVTAFARCKQFVVKPKESKQNSHLKNHYSTLEDVGKAIGPALEESGLIVIQSPTWMDGQAANVLLMETTIIHVDSGQWMSDICQIPLAKQDCQGFGSSLSYARRYAKVAIFDLNSADDDGNKAVKTQKIWNRELEEITEISEIGKFLLRVKESGDAGLLKVMQDKAGEHKVKLQQANSKAFTPAPKAEKQQQAEARPVQQSNEDF